MRHVKPPPAQLAALLLGLLATPLAGADQGTTADLEPESAAAFGLPGEVISHKVSLANTGPAPATYDLLASVELPWKAWFERSSVDVAGQSSVALVVKVQVPPDMTREDYRLATFTATNRALASDKDNVQLKIAVTPPEPRINATLLSGPWRAEPGVTTKALIQVLNEGDYAERILAVVETETPEWHVHQIAPLRLERGASANLTVVLEVPAEAALGTHPLRARLEVPGYNGATFYVPLPLQVEARGAAPGEPGPRFEALPSRSLLPALAASLVVPAVAVLAWEGVRVRLLLALWGLFSRLDETSVLDHERRARILQAVQANPGIHFGELRRLFELGNGTLAHHLRMLSRNGLVRTRHDGFRLRHYPAGGPIDAAGWLSEAQRRITLAVEARPGLRMRDLSASLSLSRQVVNYHVQRLVRAGHLRAERDGLRPRFFPAKAASR